MAVRSSGPIRYFLVSLVFPEELSVSFEELLIPSCSLTGRLDQVAFGKGCYPASRSFGAFVEIVGQEMTGEKKEN